MFLYYCEVSSNSVMDCHLSLGVSSICEYTLTNFDWTLFSFSSIIFKSNPGIAIQYPRMLYLSILFSYKLPQRSGSAILYFLVIALIALYCQSGAISLNCTWEAPILVFHHIQHKHNQDQIQEEFQP